MEGHVSFNAKADTAVFSQTADKTIVNTVTETSALGDGIGSKMILANSLTPGRRIRIHGEGIYSIPALLASSVTIKVKMNGTVIGQVATTSLLAGATNKAFDFDCILAVRTVGTAGKLVIGGAASYTVDGGGKAFDDIDNGGNEVAVDTTIDQMMDVTITWNAASASRTLRTTIATIMVV